MCPTSLILILIPVLIFVAIISHAIQTEKKTPEVKINPVEEKLNLQGLSFIDQAKTWSVGKQWWWRGLLLIWFVFAFISLLKKADYYNLFSPLNLCIHEIGHVIFSGTGQFLMVAGGTITQLAAPFLGMWNFYLQKDFFAMSLCFGWLSTNLFNVSVYMADARSQVLPLVSLGGGESHHDWAYLFGQIGLLQYDHIIAGFVWFLAMISMIVCFITGGWLLNQMIRNPNV